MRLSILNQKLNLNLLNFSFNAQSSRKSKQKFYKLKFSVNGIVNQLFLSYSQVASNQ